MSIKSRQVAGVTSLVVIIVAALSAYHLATLARLNLEESASRGKLLRQAIFQRASEVVPGARDPYAALRQDGGIRSLLMSSVAYSGNVTCCGDREPRGQGGRAQLSVGRGANRSPSRRISQGARRQRLTRC
jgi:hypothetical protein